jgi:hypothetical protein
MDKLPTPYEIGRHSMDYFATFRDQFNQPWFIAAVVLAILWLRMDRLGRQLEAIDAGLRAEISPAREREILAEWKENRDQQAKDTRIQLIVWGIILAVIYGGLWLLKQ